MSRAHAVPSHAHLHVPTPMCASHHDVEPADPCFRVAEPCKLCTLLGKDNAGGHEFSTCFANPRSHHCKAKVYRARMADLVYKGHDIPAYMFPPPGGMAGDKVDWQGVEPPKYETAKPSSAEPAASEPAMQAATTQVPAM